MTQKDEEAREADLVNDVNSDLQDGAGADEYFCLSVTGSTDLAVLSHVPFSISPLSDVCRRFSKSDGGSELQIRRISICIKRTPAEGDYKSGVSR